MRLKRLVAMLKENRYPNHQRFLKELRQFDMAGAAKCSAKTLQRDIAYLKSFYNAPIEYDRAQKGYYLLVPSWSIDFSFHDSNETQAAVIGARVAENIMPSPVKQEIREAVDSLLSATSCEADDYAMLEALVTTCNMQEIPPEIFKVVFTAWKRQRIVELTYGNVKGEITRILFEPHTLVFHEGNWYSKGMRVDSSGGRDVRTLAVHRICSASLTPKHFTPDRKLIDDVNKGNIFNLPMTENIRMELTKEAFKFVGELFPITVESKEEGRIIVNIAAAPKYKVVNYIMASGGEAKLLSHPELQQEIRSKAAAILELHTADKKHGANLKDTICPS